MFFALIIFFFVFVRRDVKRKRGRPRKAYPCAECGKSFKNAGGLTLHKRTHRTDSRKTECPDCGRQFDTEIGMKRHRGKMHGKRCAKKQKLNDDEDYEAPHIRHQETQNTQRRGKNLRREAREKRKPYY